MGPHWGQTMIGVNAAPHSADRTCTHRSKIAAPPRFPHVLWALFQYLVVQYNFLQSQKKTFLSPCLRRSILLSTMHFSTIIIYLFNYKWMTGGAALNSQIKYYNTTHAGYSLYRSRHLKKWLTLLNTTNIDILVIVVKELLCSSSSSSFGLRVSKPQN